MLTISGNYETIRPTTSREIIIIIMIIIIIHHVYIALHIKIDLKTCSIKNTCKEKIEIIPLFAYQNLFLVYQYSTDCRLVVIYDFESDFNHTVKLRKIHLSVQDLNPALSDL